MKYIAYGSNMNSQWMAELCPQAKELGTTVLEDYTMRFCGNEQEGVYATVIKEEGARLPVVVWEIDASDHQALDRYEDYPHLYDKVAVEVKLQGQAVTGMMYVMNDFPFGQPAIAYLERLMEAYETHGFDPSPMAQYLTLSR